ncbi:uncharacterized protein PRCAT00002519001 [Priceomyces carsonii]|uniref:uncharacterized protein n=1 Tax=Priceomyces carsonii TaxID=28549 RepID=UPI002EDB61B2|nr:unnamed protein product [Priceomyces carsonii]
MNSENLSTPLLFSFMRDPIRRKGKSFSESCNNAFKRSTIPPKAHRAKGVRIWYSCLTQIKITIRYCFHPFHICKAGTCIHSVPEIFYVVTYHGMSLLFLFSWRFTIIIYLMVMSSTISRETCYL